MKNKLPHSHRDFTDASSTARLLEDCADALLSIRADLRAAGFASPFVDFDWMRKDAGDEEWEDLLAYERAYVREVVWAASTSSILYSDSGQYEWRTPYFKERAKLRFDEHGSVESLLGVPARRYLVQLTRARQRLMDAIEGLTAEAAAGKSRRFAMHDQALSAENAITRGPIAEARKWWSHRGENLENLRAYLCEGFEDREISDGAGGLLLNFQLADAVQMAFGLDVLSEVVGRKAEGAFFAKFYIREGAAFSSVNPPRDDECFWLVAGLPNEFANYSRFYTREEFIVCAAAWREALRLVIAFLRTRGWH